MVGVGCRFLNQPGNSAPAHSVPTPGDGSTGSRGFSLAFRVHPLEHRKLSWRFRVAIEDSGFRVLKADKGSVRAQAWPLPLHK